MMPDLDHEATPPSLLKTRVLRSLRGQGLLRPTARWVPRAVQIAAALLLLLTGGFVGRRTAPQPPPQPGGRFPAIDGNRYMLLLYSDENFQWAMPEAEMVAEYRGWATNLRAARFTAGERLGDVAQTLLPADTLVSNTLASRPEASTVGLAGFFMIQADSWEEAVAIARTCPHLRYGGRIEVRPVVPT